MSFGHSGAGGSVHGGWPLSSTGCSYVMNQMRMDPEDLRTRHVLAVLHKAIADA